MNRDTQAAWSYHDGTKHSWASVRQGGHSLDWGNRPLPFKIYETLEPVPLPRQLTGSGMPAIEALLRPGSAPEAGATDRLELADLSRVLYFSAGITRERSFGGGKIYFRAAACTGALYHIELYLVCGDLEGLEAGVYHFSVHDFALRRLRAGDHRRLLEEATGKEPAVVAAPATLVCTTTFWRNSWKYRARAYRHAFWDCGTVLANALAVAAANDLPARVVMGFADAPINALLDLDTDREVSVALLPLGRDSRPALETPPVGPLGLKTMPLSKQEVDYPAIRVIHHKSSLATGREAGAWRRAAYPRGAPGPVSAGQGASTPGVKEEAAGSGPGGTGRLFALPQVEAGDLSPRPIEQVVLGRGSTRRFSSEPITLAELSIALRCATAAVPVDFLGPSGSRLNDLYLIVNAVEGLPPGAYVLHGEPPVLELLGEGDLRSQAGRLGLDQELPADAAADIFFLADLHQALDHHGNRGYRAAQLEAGIRGGKLYLAAYAQGFGATGLTFYDDEVTDFFSPRAEGKSVMFLVALGRPLRRGSMPPAGVASPAQS